jgi:hypothetical protein
LRAARRLLSHPSMKIRSIVLVGVLATTDAFAAPVCSQGELFAGKADFDDPMKRPVEGQDLHATPPLGWRSLVFVGDKLVTTVGQEIWYTDTKAAKPVLKRLAGKEDRGGQSSKPGTCANARFANISGIALMPDGSLAGADQTANDIFVVKDPFGPGCAVSMIAGSTKPIDGISPGSPPNVGDVDGPGAKAKFKLPNWVAVEGGAIYFIDSGALKLKKVMPDAAHTVKTVAKLEDGVYYDLVALKGKLYMIGNNTTSEGFIVEVTPAGAVREVVKGRSDAWQGSGSINVGGLATDGTGLFTTQSGQLLYVTLDGQVSSIAGNGASIDFQGGYDLTKPHKAADLQIPSMRRVQTAGANVFLGYKDGNVYYSGTLQTVYVEKIGCK